MGGECLVLVAGEEQQHGAEVLVQVGAVDIGGQRPALGAVRGKQDDFAIAAFGIGREDRRHGAAGHRTAEDQVPVGEVDADVFLEQGKVADAVTLRRVEPGFAHGPRHIRHRARPREPREKQSEKGEAAQHGN